MALRTPLTAIAATSAAVLALLGGTPASALASTPTPTPTSMSSGKDQPSAQDRQFLVQAHQGNLAEIAAGKLAQRKGTSKDVRAIGALLVADHAKLDRKLRDVAQRLRVSLPHEATARQQTKAKELGALSGAEFDKAWTKAMIYGHRAALAAARKEADSGSLPQVEALAKASQPVIQDHLDKLLAAQKSLGALGAVPPRTVQVAAAPQAATG
ncbi:DUF4142 domain-containing protein [Streptosporangium sp. NPDC003464]